VSNGSEVMSGNDIVRTIAPDGFGRQIIFEIYSLDIGLFVE